MSPEVVVNGNVAHGFPRVSGDEPQAILALGFTDVFSPRQWG